MLQEFMSCLITIRCESMASCRLTTSTILLLAICFVLISGSFGTTSDDKSTSPANVHLSDLSSRDVLYGNGNSLAHTKTGKNYSLWMPNNNFNRQHHHKPNIPHFEIPQSHFCNITTVRNQSMLWTNDAHQFPSRVPLNVVIGIPTFYSSARVGYFVQTINRTLSSVLQHQSDTVTILILHSRPLHSSIAENLAIQSKVQDILQTHFPVPFAAGIIRFISPPASLYLPLLNCAIQSSLQYKGSGPTNVKVSKNKIINSDNGNSNDLSYLIWRSKLVLDAAYLFNETQNYLLSNGNSKTNFETIVMRLEDDVAPRKQAWLELIANRFMSEPNAVFINLKTSSLRPPSRHMAGSYAWAIHPSLLPDLTRFLFNNFDVAPLDWIVGGYFERFYYRACTKSYQALELFDHTPLKSTHSTRHAATDVITTPQRETNTWQNGVNGSTAAAVTVEPCSLLLRQRSRNYDALDFASLSPVPVPVV